MSFPAPLLFLALLTSIAAPPSFAQGVATGGGPATTGQTYLPGFASLQAKLDQGTAIQVTYLGGSATKGATTHPKVGVGPNGPYDYSSYIKELDCWRAKSFQQLRSLYEQWPGQLIQRDASLGATGSELAGHRFVRDIGPTDLLICEFAINDVTLIEFTEMGDATDRSAYRTMLSVVRQARAANPEVAIVFVIGSMRDYLTGQTEQHVNFRKSYATVLRFVHDRGIPYVDLVDAIHFQPLPPAYDPNRLFDGPDMPNGNNTHPSPIGHAFYAETTARDIHRLIQLHSTSFAAVDPLPSDLAPYPQQARPYWAEPLDQLSSTDDWEAEINQESWLANPIFTNRKALFAQAEGATLTVPFEGTAVGLWWAWNYDGGLASGRVEVLLDGVKVGVFARPHQFPERPLRRYLPIANGLDPDQPHELILRVLPHPEPLRLALHGVLIDG